MGQHVVLGVTIIIFFVIGGGLWLWKGKSLFKSQIFRTGVFKQAKFWASSPSSAQPCLYISEAGTISIEQFPIHTGFCNSMNTKKTWLVVHPLKHRLQKNGETVQDEPVLLISDRSYLPLDPNGTMPEKAKAKLASLKDIAKVRHAGTRAEAGRNEPQKDIAELVITGCFILIAIGAVFGLILKWRGG